MCFFNLNCMLVWISDLLNIVTALYGRVIVESFGARFFDIEHAVLLKRQRRVC